MVHYRSIMAYHHHYYPVRCTEQRDHATYSYHNSHQSALIGGDTLKRAEAQDRGADRQRRAPPQASHGSE